MMAHSRSTLKETVELPSTKADTVGKAVLDEAKERAPRKSYLSHPSLHRQPLSRSDQLFMNNEFTYLASDLMETVI